eukprot:snap_masked-scaffold_23-processed-gene-5.35-mRNA-1 protein AED:1.00 eAED:1.00 QI:0/0/0/0/1/1/3/0/98
MKHLNADVPRNKCHIRKYSMAQVRQPVVIVFLPIRGDVIQCKSSTETIIASLKQLRLQIRALVLTSSEGKGNNVALNFFEYMALNPENKAFKISILAS